MGIDHDALMALIADYQSRMVTVIQSHGASIKKIAGDGIMATFSAALPTETYAADALSCVEDLGAAAQPWQAKSSDLG